MRSRSRVRLALMAVLAAVLVFGVTALVGVAAPPPGKGNPHPGKGNPHPGKASPAKSQYGPAGKQYGRNKVPVCHRGKTLFLPQPAARAHLRHGDRAGRC